MVYLGFLAKEISNGTPIVKNINHPVNEIRIPNARFCFQNDFDPNQYNFTVDCIFLYGNNKSNIFHGCQPWLQSLPPVDDCTVGYMFRSNGMMFSNTNETEPTNIQFMFNANLPLNVFIKDDCFDVNIVDPTFDPISSIYNFTDEENKYSDFDKNDTLSFDTSNANDYSLCPYEWMYLSYTVSINSAMTNDWKDVFGFKPMSNDRVVLNSVTEYHSKQYGVAPLAIMQMQPASYIEAQYIEERAHTVLQALGLIGGLYGSVAGIYIILFGQRNLDPFGFVQRYFFRHSVKERLVMAFRSSKSGLPLVNNDKLDNEPEAISERVRNLEALLTEYFIDAGYLEQLKEESQDGTWPKMFSISRLKDRQREQALPESRASSTESLEMEVRHAT
ncbi:hypothetical protein BC938DRAFT_477212 [Jimgerdemannia flammicorona]|uniref:Uncharacterized protein n=1 Tax=Jimgerdemannia flammicorona TaxID=994334 RepID=A0A433QPN6_9FUNG|nr:hypothetical protein BC938DRAFT_477212 [Jimgerdemannia flammicorona]